MLAINLQVLNYVNNLLEQNMHVVADLAETKSHTTKTDFWLVSPRTSKATDQYMSDLAQATHSNNLSDAKYLKQLKRKIPIFNKTDELLLAFYERKVPLAHAVWFIKLTKATQSCKEQIKSMEKTYHGNFNWPDLFQYDEGQISEVEIPGLGRSSSIKMAKMQLIFLKISAH